MTRTERIRKILAFGLNLAESVGVDPTDCGAEVARNGGWSSLSMWFATPEDMLAAARALCDEGQGEYHEQGEPGHRIAAWTRDPYEHGPVLDGEQTMYVRLTAHADQTVLVPVP